MNGHSVTDRLIVNHLREKHGVVMQKTSISCCVKKLGLCHGIVGKKRRKMNTFRVERIRDHLTKLDEIRKHVEAGDEEKCVEVCFDKSHVNQNHSNDKSCVDAVKGSNIEKKSGKGKRLVILHAVTEDGPLAQTAANGKPFMRRSCWNKDTPHSETMKDGEHTCETFWVAQSSTGNYHDNVNSKNFMEWVEKDFVPTFKVCCPEHKMVATLDNAPHHHKREIGSLQGIKKKDLSEKMEESGVKEVHLPWTPERCNAFMDGEERLHDCDELVGVDFNMTEQAKRASKKNPFVGTLAELSKAFLKDLKERNSGALECKFERRMNEEGFLTLWTPPHCPDLQPIENFWGCGKNCVARWFNNNTKMRDVVRRIRDGWCKNDDHRAELDPEHAKGTSCEGLVKKADRAANEMFMPMCPGITGTIGDLEVDETCERDTSEMPIDELVVDITEDLVFMINQFEDEDGVVENVVRMEL